MTQARTEELLSSVGVAITGGALAITSPSDGALLAQLAIDTAQTIDSKTQQAAAVQHKWAALTRDARIVIIEHYSATLRAQRDTLAELITLEAGKTAKEAMVEADGSADILLKTIKDTALPELSGMLRRKEREAIGMVGLITSFNFPLVVAHWSLAPALLAGNGIIWKPSEKTPLVALAAKAIWNKSAGEFAPLFNVIIGLRDAGEALVAHESVNLISATGSVGMGKGIKHTLATKKTPAAPSILELGGNNGMVISNKLSAEHLEWSVAAVLNSFFGTSGQRCTNTRRLIVHKDMHEKTVALLSEKIKTFLASGVIASPLSGASNEYGYGPLIDANAYQRFEKAKQQAIQEGGKILFGARLLAAEYPNAYYVEPALAIMPAQSAIMHEETFAPLLYVVSYEGDVAAAAELVNAPGNAGLVGGIYTQSQHEADQFARANAAGHTVINSAKGTGTPAYGMGFGGNKDSGEGEILNAADPLAAFTKPSRYIRVAQNKDIAMDRD